MSLGIGCLMKDSALEKGELPLYTTTVKTRKLLKGKAALKICAPLFIWFITQAIVFLIAVEVESFVILPFFIVILTIIPITYRARKKTAEFRGKESFIYEEVTFHAADGELYVDDIKVNATYNESKSEICVDDIAFCEGKYGTHPLWATFIGIVEEPYLRDFVSFLEEQGIQIHQESEIWSTYY